MDKPGQPDSPTLNAASLQILQGDRELLKIICDNMSEAARRSGAWLACKPGCTQCCMGPFTISQLDALRLREGLRALSESDPARAKAVRLRAELYVRIAAPDYPGDPVSGALADADALPDALDELPCPALDPATGLCDLYDARPITCRTFGPAVRAGDGPLGHCELCYEGTTEQQTLECAVDPDPEGVEDELVEALAGEGAGGMTIVAWALTGRIPPE
jgi:Fe-S-cluster containining protein